MRWLKVKIQLETYFPFSKFPAVGNDFKQYISETPNKKHVSVDEKFNLIGWVNNPMAKPSCQKDYSRRNYAQKTYRWDESRQKLLAMAKKGKGEDREVVTVDEILHVVEMVHMRHHGGWDATWEEVSNKYSGIVRSDVIFLVRRCGLCRSDPRKQAKGSQAPAPAPAPSPPSPPMTPPEAHFEYDNDGIYEVHYYPDDGWQGDEMTVDPALLMQFEEPVHYSLDYEYSQGEASGSNSYEDPYTYGYGDLGG